MSKQEQAFRGSLELLAYVLFLVLYANLIDPALTTVDTEMRDAWTKPNTPERTVWDTQNWISDQVGTYQDTRSLLHKIGNILLVLPIVPALTISRRVWIARNEDPYWDT